MNTYQILLTVNLESETPIDLKYAAKSLAEAMEGFEFDAEATEGNPSFEFNKVARISSVHVDSTTTGFGSVLRDS